MIIKNANVFIDGRFHRTDVRYNENEILEIAEDIKPESNEEVIDAEGYDLYAGLIDCHIHGGFFRSFTAQTKPISLEKYGSLEEQVRFLCKKVTENGVTSIMPTFGDLTVEEYQESIRTVRKVRKDVEGADPFKFHFEGAYQNPQQSSSFEHNHDVLPSIEHTRLITDDDLSDVSIVGIAPEMPGSMEYLDWLYTHEGVHAEAGYTKAPAKIIIEAADHGLDQTTHMFNGFEPMHHRIDGPDVGIMLDDRIKCQLTLDSFHVSPYWCKFLIKVKGLENVYGLTDLSEYSGLPEGQRYELYDGHVIIAEGGFIKDEDGTIHSGNNTMDETMRKARHLVGLTKEQVGSIFAENPALCLGVNDRGKIEVGRRSDFVIMDDDYHVQKTIIKGKIFYEN